MKEVLVKYKHFTSLIVFAIVGMIFGMCERILVPKFVIYSKIDDYIPFVKEAIIPYLLWYAYIGIAIIYLGFVSKIDFQRLTTFFIIAMVVAVVIYVIFPNEQALRPVITDTDVFSRTIKFIYSYDTPTNVCPSIHVLNSIAVHSSFVNCEALKDKKFIKIISFISMILISISTVLVKQHSIIDVFWGGFIGFIIYIGIYLIPNPLSLGRYEQTKKTNSAQVHEN